MFHIEIEQIFSEYISQYKKVYKNQKEREESKKAFIENLSKISQHRWKYNSGKSSHLLALNRFADQNLSLLHPPCYKKPSGLHSVHSSHFHVLTDKAIPSFVDWRTKGAVSPLKDQGIYCLFICFIYFLFY